MAKELKLVEEEKQATKNAEPIKNKNIIFSPSSLIFLTIASIAMPFLLAIALSYAPKSFNFLLDFLDGNIGSSIFMIVSSMLYLVIVVWCYQRKLLSLQSLGLQRITVGRVLIYVFAGVGWYFLLTLTFSILVKVFFPWLDTDQAQNIGIQNLHGLGQQILAYVSLAVVPPLVEETLFRGFLFKGLRKKWPFWLSALVTSFIFALAHGQLNVGLDVFALSLVLCYITDKTGSIIPGIIIHALKNSLAYVLLFTHLFPMI